jgi:hypothetical protein
MLSAKSTSFIAFEVLEHQGWGVVPGAALRGGSKFTIAGFVRFGGTHRIENLEPVCWNCQKVIQRLERSA